MPSVDRISALQDDILCFILSFLPTKNSVATSVLATRWRYLWTHVPNIDFDSEHYKKGGVGTSFSDIIYRVMLMYKVQNLNNFRLSYKDACGEYQLETCIATAVLRNVKNLYLDIGNQVTLPPRIFTYKALTELKLHRCGGVILSESSGEFYLPALKVLYLASVMYASDKSLERLISGCPVLEELFIVRTYVDPLVCCYISSATLNKLVLFTNFTINGAGAHTLTYRVKIETPALRYLELHDTVSKDISVGPLTSLVTAYVQFVNCAPVEGDVLYPHCALQLVSRLSNVKTLTLCISLLELVPESAFSRSTVKFPNLTRLTFYGDRRFISIFLVCADNLETLTINMVTKDLSCCWLPLRVPTCLMSRLRWINIDQFKCTKHEFNLVRYLLSNAKILKRMNIFSPTGTDFKAKFEALNQISSYPRGSEECEVHFQ